MAITSSSKTKKILIKDISYLDENFELIRNQSILISPPFIEKIFSSSEKINEENLEIVDGKNKLLMSGFVNNHAHNAMTLLRGYAENLPLDKWLFDKVFPFENNMTASSGTAGIKIATAEMLKNGIVSSSDMYFFAEESIEEYLETGMKVNFSRAIVSDGEKPLKDIKSFQEAVSVYEKYNNKNDEQIKIDFAIHAEYTSTEKTVQEFSEYIKDIDTGIHLHIAETEKETEECKERRNGRTPVKYFHDYGLLSAKTIGAHLVWTADEDLEILKETGVYVATCPQSNLKLASGLARLKDMYEKDINITIGTDSAASNNSLDILAEIKIAYLLQRNFYKDFSVLTPKKLLQSATVKGFESQRRFNSGAIKEGNRADLIVINLDSPNLNPCHNILNNLVFSGSSENIIMTIVDGKILYKNGEWKTIDIERANFEAEKERKLILVKI